MADLPAQDTLKQLREEMERELDDDLFFFPEHWGVSGYKGDGKVWFIGQKPSTSVFPDRHVKLFYQTLKDYGFANAHITDVSKVVGEAVDEIPESELEQNRPFFEREIEILQPELLVTVGGGARTALEQLNVAPTIKQGHVRHYSWASRWGKEDEFEDDVVQVAGIAKAWGIHSTC